MRCDARMLAAAAAMIERIKQVRSEGDSVGGLMKAASFSARLPASASRSLDKLEADLAKVMLSLLATKGFEIGSGLLEPGSKVRSTTMLSGWKRCAFAL